MYYEWVHGAAMGSSISPFITNLFMEEFEVKALNTAPHPPHLWLRFVGDTFVIQKTEHRQQHHINVQDPHIWFTMEETSWNGSLPFLDSKVTPCLNNILITTVYRKPTHMDQYLHWDSNHFIAAKHSVFNALAHRAKVVSNNQQSLHQEPDHIREALQSCNFPTWALNKLQQNFECKHYTSTEPGSTDNQTSNNHNNNGTNNNNNNNSNKNISIVFPYLQGLGEKSKGHAITREYKYTSKVQTQ